MTFLEKGRKQGVTLFAAIVCICVLYFAQNESLVLKEGKKSRGSIWLEIVHASAEHPRVLNFFTAGSTLALSDLLWIQALQTTDIICPKEKQISGCHSILSELTLSSLQVDPRNMLVARSGLLLSDIVVRDVEGGTKIFDFAFEKNPADWRLNYYGGYHFLEEDIDLAKSAKHFQIAYESGGPRWLASLSGRLLSKSGQYQAAREFLQQEIQNTTDPAIRKGLEEHLKVVNEKLKATP